ncbi:hypothetical protein [Rhizobium sp. CNPSo 4039]|uniref:hypothetical protein n=1 Tax=Rhizobium sp. CNPSo 4039 TaxID=3021409 RepID=UPI00254F51F5|nr:hypothetical protein [Rhizobium sp. CNPSo 4039]MDK4716828.1 hypothetical protein [Rhizobium sp. CNPSo 4039]
MDYEILLDMGRMSTRPSTAVASRKSALTTVISAERLPKMSALPASLVTTDPSTEQLEDLEVESGGRIRVSGQAAERRPASMG